MELSTFVRICTTDARPFFLHGVALRDLTNPTYCDAYQVLREELTTDVISEAQFLILEALKTQTKFVCDAL